MGFINHTRTKGVSKKSSERKRRHARVRARIRGTASVPRLSVYKSNRYLYAQMIDDEKGHTLLSLREETEKERGVSGANSFGRAFARAARDRSLSRVVFDRGGFLYTGRIKAFADGARTEGLEF